MPPYPTLFINLNGLTRKRVLSLILGRSDLRGSHRQTAPILSPQVVFRSSRIMLAIYVMSCIILMGHESDKSYNQYREKYCLSIQPHAAIFRVSFYEELNHKVD